MISARMIPDDMNAISSAVDVTMAERGRGGGSRGTSHANAPLHAGPRIEINSIYAYIRKAKEGKMGGKRQPQSISQLH